MLLFSGIKMFEGLDVKKKDAGDSEGTVLQLAKLKFKIIIIPMAIPVLARGYYHHVSFWGRR